MTTKELEKIKLTKRWPIKFSDFYSHFFFIIFPLAILIIGSTMLNSSFNNNIENLKFAGFSITAVGVFLTLFILKRLYQNQIFKSFEFENLTVEKIENAIKQTNLKSSKFYNAGYFVAKTKQSFFSWGEEITIIQDENSLLINSRPISLQPITIFKDRSNIRKIITGLKHSR